MANLGIAIATFVGVRSAVPGARMIDIEPDIDTEEAAAAGAAALAGA